MHLMKTSALQRCSAVHPSRCIRVTSSLLPTISTVSPQKNAKKSKLTHPLLPVIGGGVLMNSSPAAAWAEDSFTAAATTAAATSAVELQATVGPAADDPVITIMFTLAIGALTVVTLGVAYLSLATWNDSRQENDDRLRTKGGKSSGKTGAAAAATGNSNDSAASPSKKKNPKAASTSKGFGSK